jgi:16S rRNA processing protein RimM
LAADGVVIGRVGRPHGLDGAFVVEGASEDERRWRVGATLLVDGQPATVELVRRVGGGRRAIRLDRPVDRGTLLTIPAAELPPPDPDSFYAFQLVGLLAVEEGGRELGTVVEVHPGLANDNVELDDGTLVPLIEDAVRAVDLDAGRLVVTPGFLPPPATSRSDR